MKKGFTLVELAIVLVIIGLITGLAAKGRSLAAAAEMREEVNKLRKYEHAFATHFAKSGNFNHINYDNTDAQQFSDNVTRIFLKQGYLVPKDLIMKYTNKSTPSTYFVVDLVSKEPNPGYSITTSVTDGVYSNVGVLLDSGSYMALTYFVCNVEVMLDDRNILTGLGRIAYSGNGSAVENFEDEQYADCSEFGSNTMLYGYVVYAY